MRICHQLRIIQPELAGSIHIDFIYGDGNHLRKKEIVTAKRLYILHFTGQDQRALIDPGSSDALQGDRGQLHFRKLVVITSGLHTTVIRGKGQILRHQIDGEFSGFLDYVIGITFRTDRYGNHHRIRADGSRPGHRNDIRFFTRTLTADHNGRHGVQHISGFPCLTGHIVPPKYTVRVRGFFA